MDGSHKNLPARLIEVFRSRGLRGVRLGGLVLAAFIGLGSGLIATGFHLLIGLVTDLFWGSGGTPLSRFDAAPWYYVLFFPAFGGLAVACLMWLFDRKNKGFSVSEVMYVVARKGGVIRPKVATAKTLVASITIGSGGSAGPEGPIIQIGSAFGSLVGQWLKLGPKQIRVTLGCGAAAGIAATFNAPMAGAFFAAEVILGEFAAGALGAVVVSSVAGTVVARTLLGDAPAFSIPHFSLVNPAELLTYALVGIAAAVVAQAFIWSLDHTTRFFQKKVSVSPLLKPAIGGLLVGAMGIFLPELMGVGYGVTTRALTSHLDLWIGLFIVVCKLIATCFSLGSGGSGGVFAPSLVMGAALGSAIGHLAHSVLPFSMAPCGAYAIVGMAAMVSASMHAPMTALLMIFELTGDYSLILPVMTGSVVATVVAQKLRKESIYTFPLANRGIDFHTPPDLNVMRSVKLSQLHFRELELLPRNATAQLIYDRLCSSNHHDFFVCDENGALVGVISVDSLRKNLTELRDAGDVVVAEDLMEPLETVLAANDTLDFAMRQFARSDLEEVPIVENHEHWLPKGALSRKDVIAAYNREILRIDLAGSLSSRMNAAAALNTWETVGGYIVAHMAVPAHLCNVPLIQLDLPRRYRIWVMLIENPNEQGEARFEMPRADSSFSLGQNVIFFGTKTDLHRLTQATIVPRPLEAVTEPPSTVPPADFSTR